MFRVIPIFVSLATLCCFQSARAETACKTIDKILYSMSLVKDIQTTKPDRSYSENIFNLKELVDEISLPTLILPKTQEGFPAESQAISQYLSSLHEALDSAPPHFDDSHMLTLRHGTSPEFVRSLQSLGNYWNCTSEALTPQIEAERSAVYSGRSITSVKKPAVKLASPALGQSKGRNREAHNGILLKKVTLDSAIPKGGLQLFFLMVFLALFIAAYYVRKRSTTMRVREKRRLLHMPVNIRIGSVDYTMIMVDVSMNGFKIQHPGVIHRQGKLWIKLGGTWYPAQIKWNNTAFAGVRFKKPINKNTFNDIVKAALYS